MGHFDYVINVKICFYYLEEKRINKIVHAKVQEQEMDKLDLYLDNSGNSCTHLDTTQRGHFG